MSDDDKTPANGVAQRSFGLRPKIAARHDVKDIIASEALEHVEMLVTVEGLSRKTAVDYVIWGLRNASRMLENEGEEARREAREKAWARSNELLKPYDAHVEKCKSCEPTKRPKPVHCEEGAALLAKVREG